jgi:metal-responsive CopG/Arc/MetJ family transcriptional regulator
MLRNAMHNATMQRTTIMAPEELLNELRRVANERGSSLAAVIRGALEREVRRHRPRPRSLGIASSGHADTSRLTAEERPEPRSWR